MAKVAGFPEYRETFISNINGNRPVMILLFTAMAGCSFARIPLHFRLQNLSNNQLISLGVRNHEHQKAIMHALREELRVQDQPFADDEYDQQPEYHV